VTLKVVSPDAGPAGHAGPVVAHTPVKAPPEMFSSAIADPPHEGTIAVFVS